MRETAPEHAVGAVLDSGQKAGDSKLLVRFSLNTALMVILEL